MSDPGRATVALDRSESRYQSVAAVLAQIADRIDLSGVSRLLIKPNLVSADRQLAATHVDAVRAVLDFVRRRYDGPITVADGPAIATAREAFANFGYEPLRDEYNVDLRDLNEDQTIPVQVYDRRLRPMRLSLARSVVEANYRISVGPPKVHDVVIVTLAIKNMVMGALANPLAGRDRGWASHLLERAAQLVPNRLHYSALAEWAKGALLGSSHGSSKLAMHQGHAVINLNLAVVAPYVWPHLAVIDGWQGMEGEGPSTGDAVDWRVAVAGLDALAVDALTASLMGFDPDSVGYLHYCRRMGLGVGLLERIDVLGEIRLHEFRRRFRPHPTYQRQLSWRHDEARIASMVAATVP
jgi:uncharacterized protein (DUF362 family)